MNNMTHEIDFSQGERGKFYRPDATFGYVTTLASLKQFSNDLLSKC